METQTKSVNQALDSANQASIAAIRETFLKVARARFHHHWCD